MRRARCSRHPLAQIEAKYYADSEDAYDMRKYFPRGEARRKKEGRLPAPPAMGEVEAGVAALQIADAGEQGGSGKKQPANTLDGEHDV